MVDGGTRKGRGSEGGNMRGRRSEVRGWERG